VTFDERGNAGSGPEIVGPTVVLGTTQEELLDLGPLLGGKSWLGSRVWLGVQTGTVAGVAAPAVDGSFMNTKDACEGGGGLALIQQLHRTTTTAFQFCCCSYWSCHTLLYECPA
jgi:hypothetical protein